MNSGDIFEHVQYYCLLETWPSPMLQFIKDLQMHVASYCIEAVRDERVELCIQLTCSQHTGSSHASLDDGTRSNGVLISAMAQDAACGA
jgi:hypothetical protein